MNNIIRLLKETIFIIFDFLNFIYFYPKRLKVLDKNKKMALVIGNGPSLNHLFKKYDIVEISENFDLFVCNNFVLTDYYIKLKPNNYILHDPMYFEVVRNKSVVEINSLTKVWEAIYLNTNWPLNIYTCHPSNSFINSIEKRFGQNVNIKWKYLPNIKFKSCFKFNFYNFGIGLIGGMTVTHLSLHLAILQKYDYIGLAGLDLNWHENILYNEINNKVYLKDTHFYGNQEITYGEGHFSNIDLSFEFLSLHAAFRDFKILQSYGDFNNVNLFRATKSFLHFIEFKEMLPHLKNK